MSAAPVMTDLFRFMELRAPRTPDAASLRRNYIYDDTVELRNGVPARVDADLQSNASPSRVGRLIYQQAFARPRPADVEKALLDSLIDLLKPYVPPFVGASSTAPSPTPLSIFELGRRPYLYDNTKRAYYLLPEKLDQIEGLKLFPGIQNAFDVIEKAQFAFDKQELIKALEKVFGGHPLAQVVFEKGAYAPDFRSDKRTLFDTLYFLYWARRRATANLQYVTDGLRVLHVLEALAVDSLVANTTTTHWTWWQKVLLFLFTVLRLDKQKQALLAKGVSSADKLLAAALAVLFAQVKDPKGSESAPAFGLICSAADLTAYFRATPVLNPVLGTLNAERPKYPFQIGLGEFKVVKQWLVGYQPGEISYIENVLKGETRERTHRRLEKTEETFSYSSENVQESQKDTQTTDRFELKQDIETALKSELAASANASVTATYTGTCYSIVGNIGGNVSYKRDSSETNKVANTFARETVTRAVDRVQQKTSQQRSVTKIFETEETNKHGFNNVGGNRHICGIYRWLDKKYKAQLFNYSNGSKRMMFEFVIPEPAAFFVESRLRAYEATVQCPKRPQEPTPKLADLGFKPAQIGKDRFKALSQLYDLSDFEWPVDKSVALTNGETGDDFFSENPGKGSDWYAKTYHCKLDAKNYQLAKLRIDGHARFKGRNEADAFEQNTLDVWVNGGLAFQHTNETQSYWTLHEEKPTDSTILICGDDVDLTIGLWDVDYYQLTICADLVPSPDAFLDWQESVYHKILSIQQAKLDKKYQEELLVYNTEMATYRNRMDELKAMVVNDLLQGQSEAFNRDIIRTELKKQCLLLLAGQAKELLVAAGQDSTDLEGLEVLFSEEQLLTDPSDKSFRYRAGEVDELPNPPVFTFQQNEGNAEYDFPILSAAKRKGNYVQFLEQTFEWQQLSYIFYPYFWAQRPKWIDMMNRNDDADPNMTAFLQAGSARVLLAVTDSNDNNAYEDAVEYFLQTGRPWSGGLSPVIGDPLFIPLHDEIRKQQDQLWHGVPEGEPWTFTLPTSLVYLDDSDVTLPTFPELA